MLDHRPRDLPLHHVVLDDGGRAATGTGVPPTRNPRRAGRRQGLHDPCRRRPVPAEMSGKIAEHVQAARQRVRLGDGAARRCGWFDAMCCGNAVRIKRPRHGGPHQARLLDQCAAIKICTATATRAESSRTFPRTKRSWPRPSLSTRRSKAGSRPRAAPRTRSICPRRRAATSSG